MDLEKALKDSNPASWELSFRYFVQEGSLSVADWLWEWLYQRINWPDEAFSIFYKGNVLIESQIFGINVLVETGDNKKRRFLTLTMFENNPYHPDFCEMAQVEEQEWRFPAVGNPYLDEPMYKIWEKILLAKLFNKVFHDLKGLDLLIEHSRR